MAARQAKVNHLPGMAALLAATSLTVNPAPAMGFGPSGPSTSVTFQVTPCRAGLSDWVRIKGHMQSEVEPKSLTFQVLVRPRDKDGNVSRFTLPAPRLAEKGSFSLKFRYADVNGLTPLIGHNFSEIDASIGFLYISNQFHTGILYSQVFIQGNNFRTTDKEVERCTQ